MTWENPFGFDDARWARHRIQEFIDQGGLEVNADCMRNTDVLHNRNRAWWARQIRWALGFRDAKCGDDCRRAQESIANRAVAFGFDSQSATDARVFASLAIWYAGDFGYARETLVHPLISAFAAECKRAEFEQLTFFGTRFREWVDERPQRLKSSSFTTLTRHHEPPPTVAASTVLPPFQDAADYIERIKSSRGLPERNMEDLVKELLVRLGHAADHVVFQIGHIDVLVRDRGGVPRIVIEVKSSLRSKVERDSALRQGFDYAGRNGAPIVIITDSDHYEIYDRRRGLDHASMLIGKFQLSCFKADDVCVFDFLRA